MMITDSEYNVEFNKVIEFEQDYYAKHIGEAVFALGVGNKNPQDKKQIFIKRYTATLVPMEQNKWKSLPKIMYNGFYYVIGDTLVYGNREKEIFGIKLKSIKREQEIVWQIADGK